MREGPRMLKAISCFVILVLATAGAVSADPVKNSDFHVIPADRLTSLTALQAEDECLMYWHFVEETEHKSVSFDVFVDASGGGLRSYRLRTSGMLLAIALGFPIMIGNQTFLLYKDRQVLNLRSAAHMVKVLFWRPGILSKVLGGVLPYFSPTFHPWDDDNREVIRIWKKAYEKTGDTHAKATSASPTRAGPIRPRCSAFSTAINRLGAKPTRPVSDQSTILARHAAKGSGPA